jgi:hypothetical protein
VVLCPIPQLLDFRLVTPSGVEITRDAPVVEPNVQYVLDADVAYYRLMLPALAGDPAGSHRGAWQAVVSLRSPDEVLEEIRSMEDRTAAQVLLRRLRELLDKPVPYNLSVHTFSNLRLDAGLAQNSREPGATATLSASLFEYDVPLAAGAKVWATSPAPASQVRPPRSMISATAGTSWIGRWSGPARIGSWCTRRAGPPAGTRSLGRRC